MCSYKVITITQAVPGIWTSFAWFFRHITITELDTENPDLITKKVNSAKLEADTRKANYIEIQTTYLKCNK